MGVRARIRSSSSVARGRSLLGLLPLPQDPPQPRALPLHLGRVLVQRGGLRPRGLDLGLGGRDARPQLLAGAVEAVRAEGERRVQPGQEGDDRVLLRLCVWVGMGMVGGGVQPIIFDMQGLCFIIIGDKLRDTVASYEYSGVLSWNM